MTEFDAVADDVREGRLKESTAPTLGLLLEAALAPHVIRDRLALLPPLERDEGLDALDHGALKWSWLMLGWATETGSAEAHGSTLTIDQEDFLASVLEVTAFVGLEYSVPVQQRAASGDPAEARFEAARLPALPSQRLHVVDRLTWMPFPTEILDAGDLDSDASEFEGMVTDHDAAALSDLPSFGEPASTIAEGERVGETWLRITPESRRRLLNQGDATLQTLAIITRARATLVRHLFHRGPTIERPTLMDLNEDLAARERLARDIEKARETLRASRTDEQRTRVLDRFFARYGKEQESYIGPLLRGELDHLFLDEYPWVTELREDLELLVSELKTVVVEYQAEHALRDKFERWKRRLRDRLAKVGLSGEAARFHSAPRASAGEEARAVGELVEILIEELQLHPEHYESLIVLTPAQAAHDRALFQRYIDTLSDTSDAVALILSRFNFAGAFADAALHDLRRAHDLAAMPNSEFYDQKLERLRSDLSSAIDAFLMAVALRTFVIKENRALRQVPPEWENDDPVRFDRTVRELNTKAHAIEAAYREFIAGGAARVAPLAKAPSPNDEVREEHAAPTIGVITALPMEFAAFRHLLRDAREEMLPGSGAGRRVTFGTVPASGGGVHRVVLALADMGTNHAAARASRLLDRFAHLPIIMVGIAAGVANPTKPDAHPRLGDVVVSDRMGVVQYDFQKETDDRIEYRHSPRPPHPQLLDAVRHFEAERIGNPDRWAAELDQLLSALQTRRPDAAEDVLLSTDGTSVVQHPHDPLRTSGVPRVFYGPIASSNTLLKNARRRDALREQLGVLAVETEASGIADATWMHESGFLVVRGISDYGDRGKNDAWQRYAAAVAALYLFRLLEATPSFG